MKASASNGSRETTKTEDGKETTVDQPDDEAINEPATDINEVAPTSLSHLVGQKSVIEQVKIAIDAAQMDAKKMDSALLVGPPGVGKSALARVIAQEMATDFHEVLGQSIKAPSDLNALLLGAKARDVLHMDEAHELDKSFQVALYLATDQKKLVVSRGAPDDSDCRLHTPAQHDG